MSFPIKVNGEIVNTVSAIWTQDKKSVTDQQYEDFYKFIANAFDKPRYRLHFQADAPIDLKCLFFVPTFHAEKFGMGRTEPGVNLYSRKVLIESKPKDLLPEWLRYISMAKCSWQGYSIEFIIDFVDLSKVLWIAKTCL